MEGTGSLQPTMEEGTAFFDRVLGCLLSALTQDHIELEEVYLFKLVLGGNELVNRLCTL